MWESILGGGSLLVKYMDDLLQIVPTCHHTLGNMLRATQMNMGRSSVNQLVLLNFYPYSFELH